MASPLQVIQLVNDDTASMADENLWILFAGNPANVTSAGSTISALRNLAIPTCTVTAVSTASAITVTAALLANPAFAVPAAPFPIKFVTGAAVGQAFNVTAYDASTGVLTLDTTAAVDATLLGAAFLVGATSQKLSSLTSNGTTVSPLSGTSPNVYEVIANELDAAVVYVSTSPLTYLDAAPAIGTSTVPFQTVEITTGANGGATTSDLTFIDFFALPLQISSVKQGDDTVSDRRTCYFKKSTMVAGIEAVGASLSHGALYLGPGQIAAAHTGNPHPFPSFKGYLGSLVDSATPFTIAGSQNFGAPNPTIVYGISLLGTGADGGYDSTYSYSATIAESPAGSFVVTLTPNASGNAFSGAPSFYPPVADIDNITISLPAPAAGGLGYDEIIYGALLNAQSFAINLKAGSSATLLPALPQSDFTVTSGTSTSSFIATGLVAPNFVAPFQVTFTSGANAHTTATAVAFDASGNVTLSPALAHEPAAADAFTVTVADADLFTQLYTNSTISWAVADVLAGLNFGFVGGDVGTSSASWYGDFPQRFPFGLACAKPDVGNYNPWAALFYNASDAYAFAFNDRIAPSPLMSTDPATESLRITLLPQTQIDAPVVTATPASANEMNLSWPAEADVTYTVTTHPASTASVSGNTAQLTGLAAGTPYEISVVGHKASTGQTSLVLPHLVDTAGPLVPTSGEVPFAVSVTWATGTSFPANLRALLNGVLLALSPTTNVAQINLTGGSGTNRYVLDFQDTANNNASIYKAVLSMDITPSPATGQATTFTLASTPTVLGSTGALTVAPAQPSSGYPITVNAIPPDSSPLVVSINFIPAERKAFTAVVKHT